MSENELSEIAARFAAKTERNLCATGAIVTERQRCICAVICLDHCRACNYSGRDLEEGCIRLDAEDDEPSEPAPDADREAGGE